MPPSVFFALKVAFAFWSYFHIQILAAREGKEERGGRKKKKEKRSPIC